MRDLFRLTLRCKCGWVFTISPKVTSPDCPNCGRGSDYHELRAEDFVDPRQEELERKRREEFERSSRRIIVPLR